MLGVTSFTAAIRWRVPRRKLRFGLVKVSCGFVFSFLAIVDLLQTEQIRFAGEVLNFKPQKLSQIYEKL
jgi:hypothetical protein